MKNKIIIGLFMLIGLISCNEDLLDVQNPNTLDTGNFWKSEKDAELGINAVYNMFYKQGGFTRWLNYSFDLKSDECTNASPWLELQDWTKFKYTNYDFWEGNRIIWRDHYKAIFRANQVLDYVPAIPFQDEAKKQRILGEARFLRAIYYYNLALLWGNVPIVDKPSKPTDQPFNSTQDSVFNFIVNDLLQAQQTLQVNYTGNDIGRATAGAAKALLARVYMMQHKWTKAKEQLYWLVEGEGKDYYNLVTNWEDNFRHTTENNIESVFEIQFSDLNPGGPFGDVAGSSMGFQRAQFFAPNGIGWGEGIVRRWVVDEFLKEKRTDGQHDRRLLRTAWFYEQPTYFPLDNNLVYGKTFANGARWTPQWDFESTNTGESGHMCPIRKYQGDYYRTFETYENPINFRYIRFADVLLMYAECINNISGPADAAKYVDRVRTRSKLANLSVKYPEVLTSPEIFQQRLEIERTLELCGELVRWADLMRWGYFDNKDKIAVLKARNADFKLFDDVTFKHKFFPIPSLELSANKNLEQNPNY
jgi:starch-binding outer membrane protein, SusD/RagB family